MEYHRGNGARASLQLEWSFRLQPIRFAQRGVSTIIQKQSQALRGVGEEQQEQVWNLQGQMEQQHKLEQHEEPLGHVPGLEK